MTSSALGNLVRLAPLHLDELPAHPSLTATEPASSKLQSGSQRPDDATPPSTIRPQLLPFINEILNEATTFTDDLLPQTFTATNSKPSPPATAKVNVLKRELDTHHLSQIPWATARIPRKAPSAPRPQREAWFARRSHHADRSQPGTASLAEFEHGLLADHSEHERAYTPDVYDARQVVNWDAEMAATGADVGGSYSQARMCSEQPIPPLPAMGAAVADTCAAVYEMCHKLPWPLAPRVFPVLLVSAKTEVAGFVVVQVPVSIEALPGAFYSNGRNVREGVGVLERRKVVRGYGRTCRAVR